MIIATAVRNALEEIHGGGTHDLLSDEQMSRINPLIRNAVATALHAMTFPSPASRLYLRMVRAVPSFWDPPELLDDYRQLLENPVELDPPCARCGRQLVLDHTGHWTHQSAGGGRNSGCRAASFTEIGGWDEEIPRTWRATPPKR